MIVTKAISGVLTLVHATSWRTTLWPGVSQGNLQIHLQNDCSMKLKLAASS